MDIAKDIRAAVSHVGALRVVTLDSLVPGKTHGLIDNDQLGWLAALLSTETADGTILVFHYPPLVVPSLPYVKDVVLQNIDALADVVRGRDVRTILTGHLHFQVSGSLAGAPVWVTPGQRSQFTWGTRPSLPSAATLSNRPIGNGANRKIDNDRFHVNVTA